MTQSTELLPCRVCQSGAALDYHCGVRYVECQNEDCGAQGPLAWLDSEAVSGWNAENARIEHSTPDRNAVLALAALEDARTYIATDLGCGVVQGEEYARNLLAQIDAVLEGATTPEPTDPAGVSGVADELADRIRSLFKVNSIEGCITGPLSDGKRYIVLPYEDYETHLRNRQERGRQAALQAIKEGEAR